MKIICSILTIMSAILFFLMFIIGYIVCIIADSGDTKLALEILLSYGFITSVLIWLQGILWKKLNEGDSNE